MKTKPVFHLRARLVALLAFVTLALSLGQARAYDRVFNLRLINNLNVPVTWTIQPYGCYEGTGVGYPGGLVHGPVAPGDFVDLTIARVQGNDCDGEQGKFAIMPSFTYPDIPEGVQSWSAQHFDFTNDGGLNETYYPNGYSSQLLSDVTGNRKDYFWYMKDISYRLSGPLDERLTMPRNQVARNFGKWDGGSEDGGGIHINHLTFRKNGFEGMTYSECAFHPFFHAQHVVRLPNKNGRAYFAVTNSWADVVNFPFIPARPRGNMGIYRSDSLDPVTDLVPNNPGTDGEMVWEQIYGWNADHDVPYNNVGSWNHPCKMDVCGGVLIVSMLDWDASDDGVFGYACRDGTKIGNQGCLVFYDVRDPENPKFWGKMSKPQLGLASDAKIQDANLAQVGGWWVLNVNWKWWYTKKVSPLLTDWTYGGGLQGEGVGAMQGQLFNSYERYTLPGETAPPGTLSPGSERLMFGNGEGRDQDNGNHVAGDEFLSFVQIWFDKAGSLTQGPKALGSELWTQGPFQYRTAPNLWTIGEGGLGELATHKKDYDACGLSVRNGMPVFYSPLVYYNDEIDPEDSSVDHIWQIHHPDNFALQTPPESRVVSKPDDADGYQNPGSLRDAIGHGGTITFADGLNPWSGVELKGGPLMVYLHDVVIDASLKPNGLTLYGVPDAYGKIAPLIQILPGLNFTMKNVRSVDDPLAAALSTTQLACATGGHGNWFAQNTFLHSAALAAQSGDITHNQESYLHSCVEGPGTLSFWWKVSSQAGADFLRFRLNGVEQGAAPAISGDSGWQQRTISIPAGHHQLRWTYSKDAAVDGGLDAAFLSEVVYAPAPPVITTPLAFNATQGTWTRGNYITASGSPRSFTTSALPAGLYFDPAFGQIWGSPAVSGTFNLTVTATNASGTSAPGTMTITIAPTAVTLAQALDLPEQALPIEGYFASVPFFGQPTHSHDGTDAAQSAVIGNNATSDTRTYFYGPGTLSFWWKVSSLTDQHFLRFEIGDAPVPGVAPISGFVDWQQVTVSIPAGVASARWIYAKNNFAPSGLDAGWVDQVAFTPLLAQALDTPPISWTTSGNANWFGQMATSVDGLAPVPSVYTQRDAAQSGDIADSQSSSMETTVTGPATLTFWWKVSSEATWDFLRFYLDNVQQPGTVEISGNMDWTQKTIPIPAGSHTLKWTYSKDGSIDGGTDTAWVDRVLLSPPHTITSALTASASQDFSFNYAITARNSATNFDATGLPPGLTINTLTGVISGMPTAPGVFNVGLQASGHQGSSANPVSSWWGSSTATLVLTVAPSTFSIETALDTSGLTWTTSSPGAWYGQPTTSFDGLDAMRASGISSGQSVALETTISGPGVLSFWWKVSSQEYVGSLLTFAMDDAPVDDIPPIEGEVGWVQKFVILPPGDHKFTWAYNKRGNGLGGADTGWVDQVQFTSGLVTTLADSGPGSLRQVLLNLNALAAGTTTVNFHDSLNGGTITLGGSEIVLPSVFIDGSSLPGGITINGAGLSRVFRVVSGQTVAVTGITIAGGNVTFSNVGGGIMNEGNLTLDRVKVTGSSSANSGGGIYNTEPASLLIKNSTISGNSVGGSFGSGGGVANFGALEIHGSTLTGNSANLGGAIYIDGPSAITTLVSCTLQGNSADQGGGLTVIREHTTKLHYCTIVDNDATSLGGGIRAYDGALFLENCIIADNANYEIYKGGATITPVGANLLGNNGTVETEFPAGPLVGENGGTPLSPHLAPLGNYGGPTQTMPPLPGSPAFNAAISNVTPSDVSSFEWPYAKDQRGMSRQTVNADLGAVEIVQVVGVTSTTDTGAYTLRKAIANADFNSTIQFDPALSGQTITLGGVPLLIDRDIKIDASDLPNGVTVNANNLSRVMEIAANQNVTISNLKLIGGQTSASGGGGLLINAGANVTLNQATLSSNTTTGRGGAIYCSPGGANIVALHNTTLSANHADDIGGAIYNQGADLRLTNCTLSGNNSSSQGGGIYTFGDPLTLTHCTISKNTAPYGGGLRTTNGTATISNSIIAGNTATGLGADFWDSGNATNFILSGSNLVGSNASVSTEFPSGSKVGTSVSPLNPRLAPLASYGGPTQTMPPLPGSPVIDGTIVLASTPATDQRGNPRPAGPLPDIGAVEAGPFPLGSLADTDTDGIPDVLEGPGGPYPQFTVGVNDSARDTDGDGSTDAQEIANMTNLNDGKDRFKPLAFGTAAGFNPVTNRIFNISFTTFPGIQYNIETSANLQGFQTLPASTFKATDYISSFQILLPANHRFARMKRL